jgi:hypothetical protein
MLNPLKWKYEDQVGLLAATLAGRPRSALLQATRWNNMDGSTCLSGGSLAQS